MLKFPFHPKWNSSKRIKKREYYSSSLTQVLLLCLICFVVVVVVMSYFLAAVTFNKFLMTVNERGKFVNQEKTAEISRRYHWFIRE